MGRISGRPLTVVVLAFALLAAPASSAEAPERAKRAATRVQLAALARALNMFEIDTGRFPTTVEGLAALMRAPEGARGWHGPYVRAVPDDPWGHPYEYRCPGTHNKNGFDLFSRGPDGKGEGGDDLGNWAGR